MIGTFSPIRVQPVTGTDPARLVYYRPWVLLEAVDGEPLATFGSLETAKLAARVLMASGYRGRVMIAYCG